MPLVRFIGVGRENKSWEARCEGEVSYEFLIGQIRKHHALYSSDVGFYDDGVIMAGFRTVGRFEVVQEEGMKI